jgi:hypothetical protein
MALRLLHSRSSVSPEEQAVIDGPLPPSRLHHVLDAIDMAWWFRTYWRQAQLRKVALALPERTAKAKAKKAAQKTLAVLATPNTLTYGQKMAQAGQLPKGVKPLARRRK